MRMKNKYMTGIIMGFSIFFIGWAIRSTFLMYSYTNKPLGGAIMALGMLITGIYGVKLLKRK
jgi:hypothetical protein